MSLTDSQTKLIGPLPASHVTTLGVFTMAATLSAASVGLLLGLVASRLPESGSSQFGVVLLGGYVFVVGGLEVLGRRPFILQRNRETPRAWSDNRRITWALKSGALLGLGFSTRIGFGLWYAMVLTILVTRSIGAGMFGFGLYGLARGFATFAIASRIRRVGDFKTVGDAILGFRPLAKRLAGVVTLASAATSLVVVASRMVNSGTL